jgi:hypothetical protein
VLQCMAWDGLVVRSSWGAYACTRLHSLRAVAAAIKSQSGHVVVITTRPCVSNSEV